MPSACPHTITAGGYLLGILSTQERNDFHNHAEACPHCRPAIEDLRPSARLLEALKARLDNPVDVPPARTRLFSVPSTDKRSPYP